MTKIFAHRGYHDKNIKENSIESLEAAYKNNFEGIEFDIWYLESHLHNLVIKHDEPKDHEILTLPKLADYFLYQNHFEYWLDFKNLNQKNATIALAEVKKIILNKKIDLNKLYFAPGITNQELASEIYPEIREIFSPHANIVAFCEELKDEEIKNYHQFLQKNQIKFLSINHNLINQKLVEELKDITIFAWTVDSELRLKELSNLGIKNLASNTIKPAPKNL
jgi:glycerophosphoryl diester phosphodiesterase